jgi:hypothetical protein
MSSRLIAIAAGCAMLGACMTPPPQAGSLDVSLGEATKYNAAVQIIDPDPVYPADGAQVGDNGEKAANASKRYRSDQVKQPERPSASSRGGGAAGGSGPR